ncbi:MAG: glycoside hydrolase family 3 N-terminal domain-containing protein [Pseudomonadota bacterium]
MTDRNGRMDRRQLLAGAGAASVAAALPGSAAAEILPWHRKAGDANLETMIGQMLLVGFVGAGMSSSWSQKLVTQLRAGEIGGVMFLKHNVKSRSGAIEMAKAMRSSGAAVPGFTSLDHEGGAVQRLSSRKGYTNLPSARDVATRKSPDQARALYRTAAQELSASGFNFNLAPVVDLAVNPRNPVIAKHGRAYSRDPKTVVAYAGAFIDAHREAGVITSIKHFPGHGSSNADSHDGFVDISKTWAQSEVEPFRQLAASGRAKSVMTGHLYHKSFTDGGNAPVTFSRKAVHDTLRKRLGYQGVVVTDDLDMGAIRRRYNLTDALVRAIAAGHDIVMMSNSAKPDPDLPARAIEAVLKAVADGRIDEAEIAKSYRRIIGLKRRIA